MPSFAATGQDIVITNRVLPLVFGIYAWDDGQEKRRIKEAGSGIFVAPGLGLTAKHVSESFGRLDPQVEAFMRRRTPLDPQYQTKSFLSEAASLVYQVSAPSETAHDDEQIRWKVNINWSSHDTDIAVLEMEAGSLGASKVGALQRYLDWYLLPPPLRARVRVYGFPEQLIEVEGDDHLVDVTLKMHPARVVEHLYPIAVHGFGEFPAFRLDRVFEHGFSGGPVLWNDHLVGIFSGPDLVSCLWPSSLLRYPTKEGREVRFSDHFDGLITASDWREVKNRATRVTCAEALAGSSIETRCLKSHAVLADNARG